ncbi:uncharacterized protein [Linepithema humile]|uniref:uncharacterized protein isoform X2 n=1 Tax=Linepithema humile TaxID=83485 RepID=UPI00351F567A
MACCYKILNKNVSQSRKLIEWSENKIYLTLKQYKEKQCPKPPFQQLCKKLFESSKPEPKCKRTTTASDDYLKVRQSLELRVKNIEKFVEDESRLITSEVNSWLENNKVACATQLKELFNKTTAKLDELIKLDMSYSTWMRKETLLLNDEIRRSFDALDRAIASNAKRIESMLQNLRNDVTTHSACVKKGLIVCRKHDAPCEFAECVKAQSEEAIKMLDRVNENARVKLEEIAKFRESVVKTHEMTAQETIEVNHKKATELSNYLDKCIVQLKRSSE